MTLLFQLFEQILTNFSKRVYHAETKRTKIDEGKGTIYRCDIRSSNYQDIRWKHLQYNATKIKIHVQSSNVGYSPIMAPIP